MSTSPPAWQIAGAYPEACNCMPICPAGLGVVVATRYGDDEPGSLWTFALDVDERAGGARHEALLRR